MSETKNIDTARKQIDAIDDKISDLFVRRMELALSIAKYKKENGIAVTDTSRETEILHRVTGRIGTPTDRYARILFNTLFDVSRSYQRSLMNDSSGIRETIEQAETRTPGVFPESAAVACMADAYQSSKSAVEKLFKSPSVEFFSNVEDIFAAVRNGICEYGLVPAENNSYHSFGRIYDLIKSRSFYIVRTIRLNTKEKQLEKSGSERQDSHYKRFICISKNLEIYPDASTISIMLSHVRRPASLYNILCSFSSPGFSVARLESRNIPGSGSDFMFYFDIDVPVCRQEVVDFLRELDLSPETFTFLGSYKEIYR